MSFAAEWPNRQCLRTPIRAESTWSNFVAPTQKSESSLASEAFPYHTTLKDAWPELLRSAVTLMDEIGIGRGSSSEQGTHNLRLS